MILVMITFIMGLVTSLAAMYFSVMGLAEIFGGNPTLIIAMGIILETGKLVAVVWLHSQWNIAPWWLKTYLMTAIFSLMLITSMGIFGGLSKSHIEQGAPVGNSLAKIERLDKKIKIEQKTIDDTQSVVLQLDAAVKTLQKYDRIRGPEGSLAVRKSQKAERADLTDIVTSSQEMIDGYEDAKAELVSTVRAFEVEVGPIKYIADMVYGKDAGADALDAAIRWLIMLIIFVFDPLAVLLLIAANYSLIEHQLKAKTVPLAVPKPRAKPKPRVVKKKEEIEVIIKELDAVVAKPKPVKKKEKEIIVKEPEVVKPKAKVAQKKEMIVKEPEIIVVEPEAKTDDKVTDNEPRKPSGINGRPIKDQH